MTTLIPDHRGILARAAELRASGTPWDDVATKIAVGTDDLRRLSREHARDYARLARRANREFARETMRATVARLRELLKSQQEGVAMMAAATLVRYDLAKLRHRQQRHNERRRVKGKRRRYELPPPPDACVTVENARCDSPPTAPQPPVPERFSAGVNGAKNSGCDSATIPPAPPAPTPPANPVASPEKTRHVDAIRRKKWIPPWLAAKR